MKWLRRPAIAEMATDDHSIIEYQLVGEPEVGTILKKTVTLGSNATPEQVFRQIGLGFLEMAYEAKYKGKYD